MIIQSESELSVFARNRRHGYENRPMVSWTLTRLG